MITIYDVAKKANVSAMTVSRVINNSPSIKKETRMKVEKAIKELDYIPNRSARSLISKDTKLLSLIITDVTNPFFTSLARGAEDKANESGYQVVFSNSDENLEKESAYIRSAVARRIDGMLLAPTGDASAKNIKTLSKHHIPFVLIDRTIEGVQCDAVVGDNFNTMQKLIDHLIQLGHKKIALITGPSNVSNMKERELAYIHILQSAGIAVEEKWIHRSDLKNTRSDEIIDRLLSLPKNERPTSLLVTNNFLAVDAIKSLRKHCIKVPEDISVVCFDDPEPIPDFNPFLTVAAQPAYEFGFKGIQMLIEKIEGKDEPSSRTLRLSSELIVRHSTAQL
jgi:LacI family transcriptional regulator